MLYCVGWVLASILPPALSVGDACADIYRALDLRGAPIALSRGAGNYGNATLTVPLLNGLWPVEGDPLVLALLGQLRLSS